MVDGNEVRGWPGSYAAGVRPTEASVRPVQPTADADAWEHGIISNPHSFMTRKLDAPDDGLRVTLRASVNADGGWGYFPGKASRLEPTSWCLLALLNAPAIGACEDLVQGALACLARWQVSRGSLSDVSGTLPNYAFNGLAAVAIRDALASRDGAARQPAVRLEALLAAISSAEGIRSRPTWTGRQDNQLVGWPWHDGTSSWVEPTAWCTLALKQLKQIQPEAAVAERIAQAERLLADRCCAEGGWNYGNSNILGKDLFPYVSSSTVALIALQDRQALPEVERSLAWVVANWRHEPSASTLSLALVAMTLYRQTTDDLERALWAHLAAAGVPGNLATLGLTLYALNGLPHGYAAFTL